MKVALLNGSPHKNGCTNRALEEIAATLAEEGIESEILWIGHDAVHGCQACGGCTRKGEGRCIFDDVANEINAAFEAADGIIVGSPVYYAGMNGALHAALDRVYYSNSKSMAHKPAAGIASARRAGTTPTIDQINTYFQINQQPVIGSTYWPMVHGKCAEDVEQDLEGLHTMRTLARNMAYQLKMQQAAAAAGVELPELEPKSWTNFIR